MFPWRQDEGSGMRPSLAHRYSGWEKSLEVLCAKVHEIKPDGILGATLAPILPKPSRAAYQACLLKAGRQEGLWSGSSLAEP